MQHLFDTLEADLSRIDTLSRETCLQLLAFNDRNGVYTDKDNLAEGMPLITLAQARAYLRYAITGEGEVQDIMEMTE